MYSKEKAEQYMKLNKGYKADSGKLKPALLLDDMSLAITEILKVLKHGEEKYSAGNWLLVENGIERYRNAADRHRLQKGIDKESGILHLAHEAVNVLMLLELKLREAGNNNDEFKIVADNFRVEPPVIVSKPVIRGY